MGIYDTELDYIEKAEEMEQTYYVVGKYFTPSSEVQVNGEWQETTFVNSTTLLLSGVDLSDMDTVSVVQRSNSSTRKALSKTHDRAYYAVKR